jgi:hypothetical protein
VKLQHAVGRQPGALVQTVDVLRDAAVEATPRVKLGQRAMRRAGVSRRISGYVVRPSAQ